MTDSSSWVCISTTPAAGEVTITVKPLIFVFSHVVFLQDCELLLLSKLGWDVYLDCDPEPEDPTPRIRLNNLNFTETSR